MTLRTELTPPPPLTCLYIYSPPFNPINLSTYMILFENYETSLALTSQSLFPLHDGFIVASYRALVSTWT